MIGVVKQKKKATGEMLEYTIEMGRGVTSEGLENQNTLGNNTWNFPGNQFAPGTAPNTNP